MSSNERTDVKRWVGHSVESRLLMLVSIIDSFHLVSSCASSDLGSYLRRLLRLMLDPDSLMQVVLFLQLILMLRFEKLERLLLVLQCIALLVSRIALLSPYLAQPTMLSSRMDLQQDINLEPKRALCLPLLFSGMCSLSRRYHVSS